MKDATEKGKKNENERPRAASNDDDGEEKNCIQNP